MATESNSADGKRLAITAESLYLANLLVLPGVAFVLLCWFYWRHGNGAPPLAAAHLNQTLRASIWAGLLLVPLPLLAITLTSNTLGSWTVAILWFVTCHAALVLAGALGLARALSGKPFRYPLIGGGKT